MTVVVHGDLTIKQESDVVNKVRQLLRMTSNEERRQIAAWINKLKDQDIEISAIETSHSIRIRFRCRTFKALQHLYKLLMSLKLKDHLEETFEGVLESRRRIRLTVNWSEQDCRRCMDYFNIGKLFAYLITINRVNSFSFTPISSFNIH